MENTSSENVHTSMNSESVQPRLGMATIKSNFAMNKDLYEDIERLLKIIAILATSISIVMIILVNFYLQKFSLPSAARIFADKLEMTLLLIGLAMLFGIILVLATVPTLLRNVVPKEYQNLFIWSNTSKKHLLFLYAAPYLLANIITFAAPLLGIPTVYAPILIIGSFILGTCLQISLFFTKCIQASESNKSTRVDLIFGLFFINAASFLGTVSLLYLSIDFLSNQQALASDADQLLLYLVWIALIMIHMAQIAIPKRRWAIMFIVFVLPAFLFAFFGMQLFGRGLRIISLGGGYPVAAILAEPEFEHAELGKAVFGTYDLDQASGRGVGSKATKYIVVRCVIAHGPDKIYWTAPDARRHCSVFPGKGKYKGAVQTFIEVDTAKVKFIPLAQAAAWIDKAPANRRFSAIPRSKK